jgi:hypothetical protein
MKTPLLIVPPLINGYEVADLQPDRSLVRNLLNQGIDVYLNDWGYPRQVDKYRNMDDYINGYLDDTVDFIAATSRVSTRSPCLVSARVAPCRPPTRRSIRTRSATCPDRFADRFRRLQGESQAA